MSAPVERLQLRLMSFAVMVTSISLQHPPECYYAANTLGYEVQLREELDCEEAIRWKLTTGHTTVTTEKLTIWQYTMGYTTEHRGRRSKVHVPNT